MRTKRTNINFADENFRRNTKIFTGNANPKLARDIAYALDMPLGEMDIGKFSDGETFVEINENVRGDHIVLVQPTCAPTNDNLMELLIMADAFRRSAVKSIMAVVPYYGYSRQDRRPDFTRTPITSRLVADMIEQVGIKQIMTVDIHSTQQQGFFKRPLINISASPELVADVYKRHDCMPEDMVVVSPDTGGVARARGFAKSVDAPLAIIDKRRPKANVSEVMNIIGDVEGKCCVVVDDMIDTGGTLCKGAAALKEHGADKVVAYMTHPILSGKAFQNIEESMIDEVVVTDTVPLAEGAPDKIRVVSIAPLIAETIRRIRLKKSISEIYSS